VLQTGDFLALLNNNSIQPVGKHGSKI